MQTNQVNSPEKVNTREALEAGQFHSVGLQGAKKTSGTQQVPSILKKKKK